jgi:hypothetical protein
VTVKGDWRAVVCPGHRLQLGKFELKVLSYLDDGHPVYYDKKSTTTKFTLAKQPDQWRLVLHLRMLMPLRNQYIAGLVDIVDDWMDEKVPSGDTNRWDFSLLTHLIGDMPGLEKSRKDQIKAVKQVRNSDYRHASKPAITTEKFDSCMKKLATLLGEEAYKNAMTTALAKVADLEGDSASAVAIEAAYRDRWPQEMSKLLDAIKEDVEQTKADVADIKKDVLNISTAAELKEEDEVQRLLYYPCIFTEEIKRHNRNFQESSRQWMHEELQTWMSNAASDTTRVFWIRGEAGMGKSAFAASVVNKLEQHNALLGAFFCQFGDEMRMSPEHVIRSLAAQCAMHVTKAERDAIFVSAFRRLPTENSIMKAEELLQKLLVDLLSELTAREAPMVLLINALDEVGANANDRKKLLDLIPSLLRNLPAWVRLVVSSRPELDIGKTLKSFVPREIREDDERHICDMEAFVRAKLQPHFAASDSEKAVEALMGRSQGRFLYVATVIEDISLDTFISELPEGLHGCYRSFFKRMRLKNPTLYDDVTAPLIKLIVTAYVPLSTQLAKILLPHKKFQPAIDQLNVAMFPVRKYNDEDCLLPYHKTVRDWLMDEGSSGEYYDETTGLTDDGDFYVDLDEGHKLFA